jgi:hypothetical protein
MIYIQIGMVPHPFTQNFVRSDGTGSQVPIITACFAERCVRPAWQYRRLYASSSDGVRPANVVPRHFCHYVSRSTPPIYLSALLKMGQSNSTIHITIVWHRYLKVHEIVIQRRFQLWPHQLVTIIGASVQSASVYGLTDCRRTVSFPRVTSTSRSRRPPVPAHPPPRLKEARRAGTIS